MEKATDEQLVAQMFAQPEDPEENTVDAPEEEDPTETEEVGEAEEETAEMDEDDDSESEDGEPDEDDEDDEQPAEQLYTVKVDGEEKRVTLEELQRGYAGQDYIQKGMREAAEQRKAIEREAQELAQHRQQLVQLYERVQSEGFVAPPQLPDPQMLETDPVGYMQADAQYRQAMQAYERQQQEMQYLRQQEEAQAQKARDAFLREQAEKLREAFKDELADETKAKEFQRRLAEGAQTHYGFSQQDLAGIEDARAVQVLNDALKYRELQAKQKSSKKPKQQPAAVTKPQAKMGQGKTYQRQKQMEKAKKSQRDEDFIPLLFKQQ